MRRESIHRRRSCRTLASVPNVRPLDTDKWGTLEGLDPLLREFDHCVKAGLVNNAAAALAEFDDPFRGRLSHAARALAMHLQVKRRITVGGVQMLQSSCETP